MLARIEKGRDVSEADYKGLVVARQRLILAARRRLDPFAAWLMPTLAIVPPRVDDVHASDQAHFATNAAVLRNPSVINFIDGCAVSLPCPLGPGLPVGLSVCGLHGRDPMVMAVSREVERVLSLISGPGPRRPS